MEQPSCSSDAMLTAAELDTCVSVVDATDVMSLLIKSQTHKAQETACQSEIGAKGSVHVLTGHIEFADVLILNKVDQVSQAALQDVQALVRKLNPNADIFVTSFSQVDLRKVCVYHLRSDARITYALCS